MLEMTVSEHALKIVRLAGWKSDRGGAPGKEFQSVVGPKRALIWIGKRPDQVGNIAVSGEYWSEGRNILESKGALLNVGDTADRVADVVTEFLRRIEESIQGSFAVRLMRPAVESS